MRSTFDHEKLQVYQDSLAFISWLEVLLQNVPKSARDQFNRASTSIALNLAEGNGKFTSPDRLPTFDNQKSCSCRFFSATWLNRTPSVVFGFLFIPAKNAEAMFASTNLLPRLSEERRSL